MPSSPSFPAAARAAGSIFLLVLLAACGDRTPAGTAQAQALLADPLEASYRQFTESAADTSCSEAPVLAMALDGWLQAVEAAGLQSRFAAETAEARRRAADIRVRCADAIATLEAATAAGAANRPERNRAKGSKDRSAKAPRPDITPDLLDAYARGIEEEIALMRANGTHFVSLSRYDEQGLQVAAVAGLPLPEYTDLRQAMHKVLHEQMMHDRYAGAAGQARLSRLEPHKRKYAEEVLARDPFASLSPTERGAVRARLDALQAGYDRYLRLAAVGD
ncbi:hypothetical protein FQY83_06290 [Luteimonas marina]|uniref:DUF3829 domain-containing protein n=1 Tax=Luteimonas marina TaxID=488485 RepID=A0A5C5UAZ7_9GAMM|nr:hypothetical protein [Luteimonas marina]TWT22620.1 hypothetical protein FQY83_06290 [Luteimonas marina]